MVVFKGSFVEDEEVDDDEETDPGEEEALPLLLFVWLLWLWLWSAWLLWLLWVLALEDGEGGSTMQSGPTTSTFFEYAIRRQKFGTHPAA